MLLREILKMELLRLAKSAFPPKVGKGSCMVKWYVSSSYFSGFEIPIFGIS